MCSHPSTTMIFKIFDLHFFGRNGDFPPFTYIVPCVTACLKAKVDPNRVSL